VRRPTDRLPPGQGVVKWREMLGLLAEKGYTGYLSYEAPTPNNGTLAYDVAREGVELTRKLLRTPSRVTSVEGLIMAEELPLFLGLNDKTVTDIPRRSRSSAT